MSALTNEVASVLYLLNGPFPDNAKDCHDAVESHLKRHGFEVYREATVKNGDGIRGRFDLVVVDRDEECAIEIDRRLVRAKSVQKLLGFDGGRIAMVRGNPPPHDIEGIDYTIGLPIEGVNA